MELEDLDFLLDLVTEDEMKIFNQENFQLKNSAVIKKIDGKRIKLFLFKTDEEADIVFSVVIWFYKEKFNVEFDLNTCFEGEYIGSYEEVFLAHKYQILEPIIEYFENKRKEMDKAIHQNPKTRLYLTTSDLIVYKNYINYIYRELKEYYHHPDYEKMVKAKKLTIEKHFKKTR
jgi:hypothetical protein